VIEYESDLEVGSAVQEHENGEAFELDVLDEALLKRLLVRDTSRHIDDFERLIRIRWDIGKG
jgi:hypothetical protein